MQHLALRTDDIVAAVDALAERGVGFAPHPGQLLRLARRAARAPVDLPVDRLRPLGILVDRDHWGQMYQIFAQSMHVRRTFFWELIERHGARTFGTSNIPALYEAKERELAAVRATTDGGAVMTAPGAHGPRPSSASLTAERRRCCRPTTTSPSTPSTAGT